MPKKYTIKFEPKADRQLGKLDKSISNKLTKAIYALADNPRPQGYKKMHTGEYRIRQGDYRIVYDIHERIITVTVIAVGHRRDI